jgi:hypothetical protein
MASPLSAKITNKSRNWFAQFAWLRRIRVEFIEILVLTHDWDPLSIKNPGTNCLA